MISRWKFPIALIVLSLIPAIAGVVRLASLSQPATTESARFVVAPAPTILHIVAATIFALLGAFQLTAEARRRWPRWHRQAGKLLVACGLVTGLSGLWMTVLFDIPATLQGPLLYGVRLFVGLGMTASLVLGFLAVRRRDFAQHEAWMIRAYALGQGAASQVVLGLAWTITLGEASGLERDLMLSLAWAINLALGEWAIHRSASAAARVPASA